MANSKKSRANKSSACTVRAAVAQHLQQLSPRHILLAFSGGLDSSVLLHSLAALRGEFDFKLAATHVHHGLSANADDWAAFCKQACAALDVPLVIERVNIDGFSMLGIEGAARKARYHALSRHALEYTCLAHHQNDQAETLLLQLARGAGVRGLAAMAAVDEARKLLRPLLDLTRADLEEYAKQHNLRWIEDESNDDTYYDRNFIRHQVLPLLQTRYPAVSQTLSRSAMHFASTSALMNDLAQLDIGVFDTTKLPLTPLAMHSIGRQANALRWWLSQQGEPTPSTAHLQQMLQQLFGAKADAQVKIKLAAERHLMRFRGHAYIVDVQPQLPEINLLWQGEPNLILPNQTQLVFKQESGGLALPRGGKLRIRNRRGGERFRPELGRPSRTLQHVLQASAIPPWQRSQLPLIYLDDTLAIVPNVGVDASLRASQHEVGLHVIWNP